MSDPWTPGPWAVEIETFGGTVKMHGVYSVPVREAEPFSNPCGTIVETDAGEYPPCLADARLIAAAPEMAALLARVSEERCYSEWDGVRCLECPSCVSGAILARIRGETS